MLKSSTLEGDEPGHDAATEERLVPKKVHQFYFVKFSPYEDPQLKARIAEAEKLISHIGPEKLQIHQKIRSRKNKKWYAIRESEYLSCEYRSFRGRWERERMNHLQLALDKLSFANSAYQGRPTNLFLSDGEFDKHKLQFRMLHKTDNVAKERQIFREIKSSQRAALKRAETPESSQLEQLEKRLSYLVTRRLFSYNGAEDISRRREIKKLKLAIIMEREKEIALAAVKGKIWKSLGSKEDLQNQVKVLSSELDQLRDKQFEVRAKIKRFKKEFDLEAIEKDINLLEPKLVDVCERKDRAHELILKLRTQSSDEKACHDQYVSLLENAKKLAQIKDVEALADLSRKEVEKFMSQWNSDKAFRDGFEKRVSRSLESRGLCKDGRVKNPGEVEVLVKPERPVRRRMKWQAPLPQT